jgi:hypothetical protein
MKRQLKKSVPHTERRGKLKSRERIVTVDLDGSVADITLRRLYALKFGPEKSPAFYDVLLDPVHFHMDVPIEPARDFLQEYRQATGGEIVYLSGRRLGTESASLEWLVRNGFPVGRVIHRRTGRKSADFKKECLLELAAQYKVDAHFGDRPDDDSRSAEAAGVPYFLIKDYVWPDFEDIKHFFVKSQTTFSDAYDID